MQMLKVIIGCTELSLGKFPLFFTLLIVEKLWNSIVESSDCATINNNYNRPLFTFNCHSNVAYGAALFFHKHSIHSRRNLLRKSNNVDVEICIKIYFRIGTDRSYRSYSVSLSFAFVMQICDPIVGLYFQLMLCLRSKLLCHICLIN